nr:alpha/beta fold hydrolase [Saccharopolyspora sp. HNM0983]
MHGIGGYGRMLAPFGKLPALADAEFLAPDLPGSGLTPGPPGEPLTYRTWVDCVLELVHRERARDGRPVVLLGFSAGGRLAYDVAALAGPQVSAVVATCLVDPRSARVRRSLAARPEQVPWSGVLGLLPRSVRVPMHWMVNIAAVSNHTQFANLVWADPLGGARGITPGFARSCVTADPVVAPESFRAAPLLLAAPAEDRWTPVPLSRAFFDRLPAGARYAALSGAGHLPVEESGLADLDRAVRDFFDENGLG